MQIKRAAAYPVILLFFLLSCLEAEKIALDPGSPAGVILSIAASSTSVTAPSALTYTGSPYTFTVNTAITTITPTVSGTVSSCSASPALPTGLLLDTTCAISGTPTVAQAATDQLITAGNAYGSTTAMINIVIIPSTSGSLGNNSATLTFTTGSNAVSNNLYWSESPSITTATGTKITGVTSPYILTFPAANTSIRGGNGVTYYFIVWHWMLLPPHDSCLRHH